MPGLRFFYEALFCSTLNLSSPAGNTKHVEVKHVEKTSTSTRNRHVLDGTICSVPSHERSLLLFNASDKYDTGGDRQKVVGFPAFLHDKAAGQMQGHCREALNNSCRVYFTAPAGSGKCTSI